MNHYEVHVYTTSISDPPKYVGFVNVYMGTDSTEDDAAMVGLRELNGDMAVAKRQ